MNKSTRKEFQAIQHYFRQHRDHQRAVWADGGGMLTTFADGHAWQLTFASAPYGEHALSAFIGAKRQIAFRANLKDTITQNARRSKAAKRGWTTRRMNNANS